MFVRMGLAGPVFLLAALAVQPAFSQRTVNSRAGVTSGRNFSGKVTLEDGSLPTEPALIESTCSTVVRKEATTDKKGAFSFALGQGRGEVMADSGMNATRSGGSAAADTNWNDCVISATSGGFRSDPVYLANLPPTQVELGVLVLHKGSAGSTVSATSKKAPKDAVKAFEKARDAAKNKKWEEAVKNLQKAVELYPEYADAWCELGKAQIELKQPDEARKSLAASIKADSSYLPPYGALLALETQAQNYKAIVDVTDRVIELAPRSALSVYYVNAAAQFRLKNYDAAGKRAQEGVALDTQHTQPRLFQVLASVLAMRGDAAGAADQLKQYLQYAPFAADAVSVKAQVADLESRAAAQPKK